MTEILQEIVRILIGGLTEMGQGIGAGLQDIVTSMFISTTGDTQTLSVFGGMVAVFAGIGLAVSLTRLCFGWLATLGARK